LWELQERESPVAKIQIAGPLTCQWALQLKNGQSLDRYPELSSQVFRVVLARALAMVYRMQSAGVEPILFLDEPGLYALSPQNPKHMIAVQELRLMIQTLRKEGATVGLHCCSNTDWETVFNLGLDTLSLDTSISLKHALAAQAGQSMETFILGGGRLSLGIIPTTRSAALRSIETKEIVEQTRELFQHAWGSKPTLIQKTLQEALYTPACGLALQTISDAEMILEKLVEVYESFHHS
jgi:hypothetical protein